MSSADAESQIRGVGAALGQYSPNNPRAMLCDPADPNSGNRVNVRKGNRLVGIPAHKFKAGIDYWIKPQW